MKCISEFHAINVQDVFGAERRKAKMLNFSIAYGKTAMGLSKDWKVIITDGIFLLQCELP